VVVIAAAAAAAADAAATTPSPFPPLSLSLQPPPTSLHLRRSCRWLVVCRLSLLTCCVVCRPNLSAPPPRRAVVNVNDDRYHRRRRLPSPLPWLMTMTAKSQRFSFVKIIVSCSGGRWWWRR
jgi:hypothetical protein